MAAHNRQEHAWAAGIDEHDYSAGRGENWVGDVRAFGSATGGEAVMATMSAKRERRVILLFLPLRDVLSAAPA